MSFVFRFAKALKDVPRRVYIDALNTNWRDVPGRVVKASPGYMVGLFKFYFFASLFVDYVGGPRFVYGPSMLPTMSITGDVVLEEALTTTFPSLRPLQRGDLIVLNSPIYPRDHICKRLLGLPGDVICVDPTGEYAPSTEHVVVPKGHVWIMGDNASHSRDSRTYGPVPMALVRGRVIARISPWKDRTRFRNNMTLLGEI